MARSRQALGKGLGALLQPPRFSNLNDDYFMCSLDELHPDPNQPRERFDSASLAELVRSIKEKGVLQPLIVRRDEQHYVLIAGERRLRAAREAGLDKVPVVVKDVASEEAFELALIENIQREDLNPIEEASAYQRLLERDGYTQDTVARRVGKDRSTVANALRLLRLETPTQQLVIDGQLSAGHARALLALRQPEARRELAKRVVDQGLSVRQTEEAVRKASKPGEKRKAERSPRRNGPLRPYYDSLAAELSETLGCAVAVKSRGRKGRLVIEFRSVEELRTLRDRLLADAAASPA